jgi:hypothetical protein
MLPIAIISAISRFQGRSSNITQRVLTMLWRFVQSEKVKRDIIATLRAVLHDKTLWKHMVEEWLGFYWNFHSIQPPLRLVSHFLQPKVGP